MAYADRDDLDLQYGRDNVDKWADLNNNRDADEIAARVAWALAAGDEEIDNRLRDGPYEVPFTTIPGEITRLSALYAGFLLYDSRGITDQDGPDDQLKNHRTRFETRCRMILSGQLKLDLEETSPSYPQVYTDDDF